MYFCNHYYNKKTIRKSYNRSIYRFNILTLVVIIIIGIYSLNNYNISSNADQTECTNVKGYYFILFFGCITLWQVILAVVMFAKWLNDNLIPIWIFCWNITSVIFSIYQYKYLDKAVANFIFVIIYMTITVLSTIEYAMYFYLYKSAKINEEVVSIEDKYGII